MKEIEEIAGEYLDKSYITLQPKERNEIIKQMIEFNSLSLQSSKGISDEEIKNAFKNFAFTNDDNEQIMELDEFEEAIKSLRSKLSEGSKTNGEEMPRVKIEKHKIDLHDGYFYTAQFGNVKGMIVQFDSIQGVVKELLKSIEVKLLYDLDLPPNELSNQTDAVEFAEWLLKNTVTSTNKEYFVQELYLIFKKEKDGNN